MMQSIGWCLVGLVAGLPAVAGAEVVTIRGAGIRRTVACDGREVEASGSGHTLTLRGRCPRVAITGTGHVVRVEGLGRGSVSGMNNRLEWEYALEGERPRIAISGVNNEAVKVGAGRSAAASDEDEGDEGAGEEGGISVEGGSGRVVIGTGGITIDKNKKSSRGGRVTVTGGSSSGSGTVSVEGDSGTVRITGGEAAVTVLENGLERTYDCAGGNAEVRGNDNVLTLRNCRQLTVSGNDNAITLQGPVRLIRVPGDNNGVTWSQGVDGKAPSVETSGSGNRVTGR
jgi:hypothetical protein